MQRIRVGMRGMEWECGCGEPSCNCRKSRWKCEKYGESEWQCKGIKVETYAYVRNDKE